MVKPVSTVLYQLLSTEAVLYLLLFFFSIAFGVLGFEEPVKKK